MMLCAAAISVFAACKQVDVNKYENDPRIYFPNQSLTETSSPRDNINHTFITVPDGQLTCDVEVDVRAMGFPADYPRAVIFRQIFPDEKGYADGTPAAVPGMHYLPFDDPQMQERMFMPAGKVQVKIPVTLIKTPELEDGKVRLEFELVANEHFNLGIKKNLIFSISSTSQYQMPKLWDRWQNYMGIWGAKKMWFLVTVVGMHPSIFDETVTHAYSNYKKAQAIDELEKYNSDPNNKDTPLKETDGTVVKFPGM